MQRIAPNTLPPRRNNNGGYSGQNESPAYSMAMRIRAEQGTEYAARYLSAMEPFLAPAERTHIAESLGLRLPTPAPAQSSNNPPYSMPNPDGHGTANMGSPGNMGGLGNMLGGLGNMGNPGNMGNLGNMIGSLGNMGGMGNMMSGLGNMGNMMQMVQMLGGLGNMGKSQGGGNPMQLAQMLGGLMGKK